MEIINLNKHAIDVQMADGARVQFAPSGQVATVAVKSVQNGEVLGIPVFRSEYGEIEGLPEPKDGVLYLVNMLVGQRATGRNDLIGPDSGPSAIRYQDGPQKGQIEAVKQFIRF